MKKYGLSIVVILVIIAIFILVYSPVLFNFLVADDFMLLGWIRTTIQHPEAILKQYFSIHPRGTVVFYRPILPTVLFLGYKIWTCNGLYFRLLNMGAELLCGVMLGFVVYLLNKLSNESSSVSNWQILLWSSFSGILFIFYPLHSESVIWITVITNPLVVLFSLISIWGYIKWREKSKVWFLILSVLSTVLAFLTKETAAALPPIIFISEMLFFRDNNIQKRKAFFRAIVKTLPYWMILFLYFCLRRIVLGDFIAGYPDELCHQSIAHWLRGLQNIVIPISSQFFGILSPVFIMWCMCLIALISLTIIKMINTTQAQRNIIYFSIVWFVIALLPSYKVFPFLMSTGVGSRHAYLPTVPLCVFLTYGLAMYSAESRFKLIARVLASAFFVLSVSILHVNNLAWAETGRWINKRVAEIKNYCEHTDERINTYVVGLPSYSNQGIFCIGPLHWITQPPFLNRDLYNYNRIEEKPFTSYGSIKDAVNDGSFKIKLLYWDSAIESLRVLSPPSQDCIYPRSWRGRDLIGITKVYSDPYNRNSTIHLLSDDTVQLVNPGSTNGLLVLDITLPKLPCWKVDFLDLRLECPSFKWLKSSRAELIFTNNIVRGHPSDEEISFGNIASTENEQEIIFPLYNIRTWSLGDKCTNIKIVLPIAQDIKVKSLFIPNTNSLIPAVDFRIFPGDCPGQLRLGTNGLGTQYVKYDARSIKAANQVVLAAVQVAIMNGETADQKNINKSLLFKKVVSNLHGQLGLNKSDFPTEPAIYRAWLNALDKNGKQVGYPTNDFFIRTDY